MEAAPFPLPKVIYSDQDVLVVDKPAGLLSLPDGYDRSRPYLAGVLMTEFGRLWVVHRLDRDTSGVMVLARSPQAHRALNMQFENRQTAKIYHAIVVGSPTWETTGVDLPLRVDGDRRHRTVVDQEAGKPAFTAIYCLERFSGYTLIEAQPHTGYAHQIRAHLAAVGHPIVGDTLYNRRQVKPDQLMIPGLPRVALHARSLTFYHPTSGERLSFAAAYPIDFERAIHQLRRENMSMRNPQKD